MDVREAIDRRRAVRDFTREPVDKATIRHLIDAAVQAPSALDRQPWCFCVIQDQVLLQTISQEARQHMLKRATASSPLHPFQEMLADPEFDIFYHAPVLIVIACAADDPWAVEDCSLAAQNLMLAAHAAGFGTCWIGFAQDGSQRPRARQR
jgi:nitroreductase